MLLAGLGFALASAMLFLFADSVPLLLIGRLLSGLSAGIFTGTATAAVVEAAPPHRRDMAATVATIANVGGLGSGPVLAGLLVQYAPHPLAAALRRAHRAGRAGRACGAAGPRDLGAHRPASACSASPFPPRCGRCS